MKIKDLIESLKSIEKQVGDKEVYLSRDSEGNGFGTIEKQSFSFAKDQKEIIIYPFRERIELG